MIRKSLIIFLIFGFIFGAYGPVFSMIKYTKATVDLEDPMVSTDDAGEDNWQPTAEDEAKYQVNIPPSLLDLNAINQDRTGDNAGTTDTTQAYDAVFGNISNKIIFKSASDKEDIRRLSCLTEMIPDYANDLGSMSVDTGRSISDLQNIKTNNPQQFSDMVQTAKAQRQSNLLPILKQPQNLPALACLLSYDTPQEAGQALLEDENYVDQLIQAALNSTKIDIRVLKMLVYLVTPKNQGGAGHDLITVKTLRNGYNLPNRQNEREDQAIKKQRRKAEDGAAAADPTVADANAQNNAPADLAIGQVTDGKNNNQNSLQISDFALNYTEDAPTISAHADGEAVDISQVDTIKCTIIKKKRVGGDTKIAQPPKPIDLIWQTAEGYDKTQNQRDSLNSLVDGLNKDGLLDLLNEFGVNLDSLDNMSTDNLGDLVEVIGQSIIGQLINSGGDISGVDLEGTLRKVGAIYLADKLKLPRAAFYGAGYKNIDDLKVNLGRASLEERLNLPIGSLSGNTSNDIFYSAGERKMEKELQLPAGTLTPDITGEKQLMIKAGARLIEDKLKFETNSFLYPNLVEIKKHAGDLRFKTIFLNPETVDARLSLDQDTSRRFASGQMTPDEFLTRIAFAHFSTHGYIFGNYNSDTYRPITDINGRNTLSWPSGSSSSRDAAFGTPDGTSDQILMGYMPALVFIGKNEIAKRISSRKNEQQAFIGWAADHAGDTSCKVAPDFGSSVLDPNNPNIQTYTNFDAKLFAKNYGLSTNDFYLIFGCATGGADSVFSRLGADRLYQAVKDSPEVAKAKANVLANNPELGRALNKAEFYLEHFKSIDRHLDNIDKEWEAVKSDPIYSAIYADYSKTKDEIKNRKGTSPTYLKELAQNARNNFAVIRSRLDGNDKLRDHVNKLIYELDQLEADIEAIVNGQDGDAVLNNIRLSDLDVAANGAGSSSTSSYSLTKIIWLVVTGKITMADALVMAGANKVEDELNLPAYSLAYFSQSTKQANTAISSGKTTVETKINYGLFSFDTQPTIVFNDIKIPVDKDHTNLRERFLASLGQAAVEEAMNLSPNSFQGSALPDPRKSETLSDVVGHLAVSSSASQAKNRLASGFGTSASLDRLMAGDQNSLSSAKDALREFDRKLGLKSGTTQSFISGLGNSLDSSNYLSSNELDMVAGKTGISRSALQKLTKVLAGEENWQVNPVDFNEYNPYITRVEVDPSTCATNDQSNYAYTDKDGTHNFETREKAANYFNAHKDRVLDYTGEIAQKLVGILNGDPAWGGALAQTGLMAYLKNPKTSPRALSDEAITALSDKTGVAREIFERLFVGKNIKSDLFSYLVIVGTKVGEQRTAGLLLNNFGISIGKSRLGINDLFDIFNGDGSQIVTRLAGNLIDSQLGIDSGTFAKIVNAPYEANRNCLLKQAGISFIFKQLGVKGINLSGDPYAAIGGSKIESVLGWPNNTFKSGKKGLDGLGELLDLVGPQLFVKGFSIPIAGLDFAGASRGLFPQISDAEWAKLDNGKILSLLQQREDMSSLEDAPYFAVKARIKELIMGRLKIIQDEKSAVWTYKPSASYATPATSYDSATGSFTVGVSIDYGKADTSGSLPRLSDFASQSGGGDLTARAKLGAEIEIFRDRLSTIDSRINQSSGATRDLILGKTSPDDYRSGVSKSQAVALAAMKLADLLGADPDKARDVQNLFSILSIKGKWTPDQRVDFYNAASDLIGWNMDKMLHMDNGTMARIILKPQNARNVLIEQGLKKLDGQLNIGVKTADIFAAKVDGYAKRDCDIQYGKLHDCRIVELTGSKAARAQASSQLALQIRVRTNGLIQAEDSQQLLSDFFYSGNMDAMKALAYSEFSVRINNTINDQGEKTGILPPGFRITWDDTIGAVKGSAELEDYAATRARLQALQELDNPDFAKKVDAFNSGGASDYRKNDGYGVTGQLANLQDQTNPYSIQTQQEPAAPISEMVVHNIDSSVPLTDNTTAGLQSVESMKSQISALETKLLQAPSGAMSFDRDPQYFIDLQQYNSRRSLVDSQEQAAKDHVRTMYRKNIEYHYMDSLLYAKDKNIPPGFTAAMYEGNAHTRGLALLTWAKNGVLNGDLLGININKDFALAAKYLLDVYQNGSTKSFEDLVKSGDLMKIDNLLTDKFDSLFGVSLAKGTFTSLLAAWNYKVGWDEKIPAPGTLGQIPTLKDVYINNFTERITGWIDSELGLPRGTALASYQMFSNLKAAQQALDSAQVAANLADTAAWSTYRAAVTGTPTSEILQKDYNTLFGASASPEQVAANLKATGAAGSAKVKDVYAQHDAADASLQKAKINVATLKASLVTFAVNILFSDQMASIDQSLGLVPGSTSLVVGQLISSYYGVAMNPMLFAAIFVAMNLFGVYKVELQCTADGYYPGIEQPPADSVSDNGNLGIFDGMNPTTRKAGYVKAAQYKARSLLGGVLDMPSIFNDQRMTPSQIMTGRREDVDYWYWKTKLVIYKYTGEPDPSTGLLSSRAGLWQNPQTTAYTHIGF